MNPSIRILKDIAASHGIEIADLRSHRRSSKLWVARAEAARRLRAERGLSYPKIGQFLGRDQHSVYRMINQAWREDRLAKAHGVAFWLPRHYGHRFGMCVTPR